MATHSSVLAWRIPGRGRASWAAIYGVAQSRTRLRRLSSNKNISGQANELEHVKNEESNILVFIIEEWCWRRLLRVPWTARRSNQSILKEISPGCCLEGMMLKLKLQYFGHLMRRVDSMEKILMLGGIWGRRRRG